MKTLTGLMCDNGVVYVDLDAITVISAPTQKGKRLEARVVHLAGGSRVFIHNSEENRAKLLPLLPENTAYTAALPVEPKKRGRKPKTEDKTDA